MIWDDQPANNLIKLALEKLKAKVKPKHFQIFHLYAIQQLPAAQVAKTLGVSQGQVYLVKFRLKGILEQIIRKLRR